MKICTFLTLTVLSLWAWKSVGASAPSITTQPQSQSIIAGSNATFTVVATGQTPLVYQWSYNNGVNLTNNAHISGATNDTLIISNVVAADVGDYHVVVSNSHGSVTSSNATLTVLLPAAISTQPTNQTVVAQSNITFSATATGTVPLSYRWYFGGVALNDGGRIAGAATASLSIANAQTNDAGAYQLQVTNNYGSATSSVATLVVLVPAAITAQPTNETVLLGGIASFSVIATGTAPLFYQWQKDGTTLTNGARISGADTATLAVSNVQMTDSGSYQLICSNSFSSATSAVASLQATLPDALINIDFGGGMPSLKTGPAVIGQSPSDFWNSYNLVDGMADLRAADGTPTSVGTMVSTPGPSIQMNSNPDPMFRNYLWQIDASQPLLIDTTNLPPGNYDLYYYGLRGVQGESYDYELLVNGTSLGHHPLSGAGGDVNSTNWQEGVHYVVYHNVTITNYGMTVRAAVNWVTLVATPCIAGLQIAKAYAGPAAPYFVAQPTNQTVVSGHNGSFSAGAFGSPAPGYHWFFNGAPLTNSSHIAGADTFALTITNAQAADAGNYFLVATNSVGTSTSAVATLTVQLIPPTFQTQPTNEGVVTGNSVLFSASATGSIPISYQWYFNDAPLSDGTNISGSALSQLSIASAQTNNIGNYYVIASNNVAMTTSAVATLQVFVPATITSQPTDQSAVAGSNAAFTASVTGDAPLTFQWYLGGTPLTDDGHIMGSTTSNLTILNVQTNDAGNYQLVVTNNYGSATSSLAALTVLVPASITAQPTNRIISAGSSATFAVVAIGTAPLNYLWYSNGVPLSNGGRISGATNSTLTISSAQTNDSAAYQVVVTNNYGSATSSVATLIVYVPVQITGQPASQSALIGTNVAFTVTATGSGPLNYQWYFNGTPLADGGRISGSATATLSLTNIQSADAGAYVVTVTNLYSGATSRAASLTPQAVLGPSVRYVNLSNTVPQSPYLDWSTAATNIQDAVDAAVDGDSVLVTNGIYNTGGRAIYGAETNRLTVDKMLTVQSVNGPAVTLIVGNSRLPSIRCVYLTNGAALIGFTLTNGGTVLTGDTNKELSGGGVWCESSSILVSNCLLLGNHCTEYGGGAYQGTLMNCTMTNNSASQSGGGAFGSTLIGCTLFRNFTSGQISAFNGGGAANCMLSNCLVVANTAFNNGGGAAFSTIYNCIFSNNAVTTGGGAGIYCSAAYDSLISSNLAYGYGGGAFSNSTLVNCTLTRNRSQTSGGGGVAYGTLTNCLLVGNSTANYGGGAYAAFVNSCNISNNVAEFGGGVAFGQTSYSLISSNRAQNYGGGAYSNLLSNCILQNNVAGPRGGGAYGGSLINCTVISNTAANAAVAPQGGGVFGGTLTNCIVYYNSATFGPNDSNTLAMSYCCTTPLPTNGFGNITNEPLFVNLSGEDFHLQTNSPCINSGNNAAVTGTMDFDANPRIAGGTVDIGAYEFQSPASTLSYAWLQQYGLATDGSADNLDADGDGFSNWQEWRAGTNPTNATSFLKMDAAAPMTSFSATVTWESVAGKNYFVQRASDLSIQPPFTTIQSNIVGQAGTTSYLDTNASGNGPFFYRVGVQ